MARPFRNEFEKESSPMSPLSSGAATPTSYKTNVNRQKTKKWVEAKVVDYGGDDWGDDDEYDHPPPPISKPTGLRQKGQALQSPTVDNGKKTYGELPSLPPEARARSNSFDADDEKRNFSSGPAHPAATPATRFSQMGDVSSPRAASGPPALHISTQQPPSAVFRSASQVVSPASESSQRPSYQPGPTDSPSKSLVSPISDPRTPSSDYQARRDFSPSAIVPPLSTRASAASQSATDNPVTKFPPRKSSMSAGHQVATTARARQESPGPKPWAADRSSSPSSSNKSVGPSSAKALPFIRPADIYKRAEEEKERQSMESSRPSMDSVLGGKAGERPGSSDKQYSREHSVERSSSPGKPQLRERLSSDSLGGRRRTSLDGEDVSESGRRLMPILAPVQERKSEYGFDGFDVNQKAPERTEDYQVAPSHYIPIEQTRVPSTSPKLPDLNRMSGFGIDMFSQSKPEEYPVSQQIETTPPFASTPNSTSTFSPVPKPESSSQVPDGPPLRNQPSLGFRSVVNQAFDRPDRAEASVPATPASRSGSGVRRSDSESTGTTGISPIMSRVPSAANPDSRNRDGAVPAVLEVVNETSPVQSFREHDFPSHDDEGEPLPPAFKPGHRRDLSTPSPGNSPARTPDLATIDSIPQAEKALLSRAPGSVAEAPLSTEEQMPPPSRPLAEREQSFRPQLPGGWQSYATTAPGNATSSEDANGASDLAHSQTPVAEVSPIHEAHDEADNDIALTTRKHSLPQDAMGAGALLGGMAAFKSHEDDSPERSVAGSSRDISGYDAMPTPDLAMAPSGGVYSSSALDPRLLPKPESVPPEAQLRPNIHDRSISAASSSAAPTQPPKDTPLPPPIKDDASGYFPKPTVPLNQRSAAEFGDDEALEPPERPHMPKALSTDTQDEESDKLRKEIIKSLSPRTSLVGPRNDFLPTDNPQDSMSSAQARESAYLPDSIYDNYWGDDGDEGSVSLSRHTTREAEAVPQESTPQKVIPNIVMDNEEDDIPPTPPLNTRKSQQSQLSNAESRPALNKRFSWEQSEENVAEPPRAASPEQSISQHRPMESDDEKVLLPAHDVELHTADSEKEPEDVGSSHNSALSEQHHGDAPLLVGGTVIGGAAVAAHMQQAQSPPQSPELNQSNRRLSLAEEKDPKVSSYPVSPTPPEDEHPANSAHAYLSDESDEPHSPVSHLPDESIGPAPQLGQHSLTDAKLLQFKEIVAMRDPHQRIQAFDEHRHRFAAMESGLSEWLSTLQSQHSEHADASGSYGGGLLSPGIGGSSRSRFVKPGGKSPLQPPQPYYQQYLNASSPTTPTTPVSQPGPSMPTGAQQQGFSSGGGKMTSQQVQAKGKELFHTAGIFSGKAGKGAAKAGKGLLAKGKSKFRGSGAGDKTNPPPKPKNERRSSWGLPLALSRSANQPDSSTNSKEELSRASESREASQSSFPSAALLNNAPDLGQGKSDQPPQIPSLRVLTSPLLSREVTSHIPEISQPASPEVQDNLSGPVPISKDLPSWDPYNSTPIVEEEGFGFDEKPKQVAALPVPTEERSERSNSGDAHFYDASEPSHDDEWVIVEPELKESSEVAKSTNPPIVPKSILDRPRDSFDITKSSPLFPIIPARHLASNSYLVEHSSSSRTKDTAPVPKSPTKAAEVDEVIPRDPAFKGLPPIRRTSTFGFGFGPRQAKPRFPIDDEDEDTPPGTEQQRGVEAGAAMGAPALAGIVTQDGQTQQAEARDSEHQNQVQQRSYRPDLVHTSSLEYSQQTITLAPVQREPSIPRLIMNPRDAQRITPTQIQLPRRSEDSWRPSPVPPPSNQQQYVDPPLSHSPFGRRLSSDAQTRAIPNPPQKQFEEPPSSAFRYPQLFRPGQQQDVEAARDSGELPDHYYQQPIHREAFMPRQQTSEYQLPGVGPPMDEPRSTGSRRNSFFGGLGGKLVRTASRERAGSISRGDDEGQPSSRQLDSRGNEISLSSPTSDEGQTQTKHKRRPSFFGNLNRVSTGGTGPPKTADSVTAQASGSRTDLLKLMSPQSSPLAPADKKRSFFRNSTSRPPLTNSNKVSRASTSSAADDGTGKKNRFSALSSMFGSREKRGSKGSVLEGVFGGDSKRQSTEGPQPQPNAQPLVSPQPGHPVEPVSGSQSLIGGLQYQPGPQTSQPPARTPSQQRNVLTKQPSLRDSSRQRQESRSRRTSGSGILSSILGRRSQDARRPEEQTNNPKPLSPQPTVPNLGVAHVPQNGSQQQPRTIPWQNGNVGQQQQLEARGRRSSREPVYDNVPIPGGYPIVRGVDPQAPISYDVRGNHQQYWPQSQPQHYHLQETQQRQDQDQRNPLQNHAANDVRERQNRPPNLGTLETYESYQRRAPRRLSREDILARSPAREPEGQQRPYQLSLPEEDPPQQRSKHMNQQMPKLNTQPMHDRIQRLQQPVLRHPESPAGYPLPADTVFSPINPAARNMPPPPAPRWPQQQAGNGGKGKSLARSDTGRTGDSEVSQVSAEASRSLAPQKRDERGSSPSPTPPSPSATPERLESPEPKKQNVRAPMKDDDDLYDASPRLKPELGHVYQGHEGKEVASNTRHGKEQEEKIFYGGVGIPPERDDDTNATMSATSYPGQEWHPYTGGYEEWD